DTEAKRLMNINEKIKESIRQHFGEATYKNEDLDRKYLADIVFNNPEKLELLNALIHPVTIKDAEEWMQRQAAPYSIKEAALLFESGAAENLDFVIGVYAPQALRIKRVMKRDNLAQDEIVKRINRQVNEEMKMKLCDFVITNNEQELLIPQVLKLHQHFISLANSSL
ncbi:MAG TPA: dephospho-CoA kinase, partial [Chitinophagaceae bacterium]|nr:dephospho-CoA kinase [Chitinophagaceae bacterium]